MFVIQHDYLQILYYNFKFYVTQNNYITFGSECFWTGFGNFPTNLTLCVECVIPNYITIVFEVLHALLAPFEQFFS